MSGLSVAGIASGIDSDSIISQMVALETRSITQLQRRIALEEAERVTFEDISSRLQALRTSTEAFSADSLFASLSATSSDSDLLTVSATDSAPRGVHKIKVLQTALAHRLGGTGVADPIGTKLGAGFTATNFNAATLLNSLNKGGDYEVDNAATSSFDYEANVELNGLYGGDNNVDMIVELRSDFGAGATGGTNLRVSFDGQAFQNFDDVHVNGDGHIELTSAAHFGNTGVGLLIKNADATMKDGDEIMFRARSKASIEYTIGDGSRQEILIESDDTLSELVRAINDDANLGLRADILNDGSTTDPHRLILTSLTDGSSGEIKILANSSIIDLQGTTAEVPVVDSITYTGQANITGGDPASGLGNSTIVFEAIEDGRPGAGAGDARFRISIDGGLTFYDNNDNGFSLKADGGNFVFDFFDDLVDDTGAKVMDFDIGVAASFTDDLSEFSVGDRITVDMFDSQIQAAQDAQINVNGINLVKSSNVVDDVFDGLTLNLQDADPTKTITVNISEKAGDITAAMNGFVESYNSAMSLIHAQSKFNPDEDAEAPLLMGDATVRQIQSSMQRYVTGRISILGGDTISSLADIGITTDSTNGQLLFDSSKLTTALSDDPNAVRRLLSRFGDVVDGSNATFVGSTSVTKAGTYTIEVTQKRLRAEVVGGAATTIQAGNDETLTVSVNTDENGAGSIRNAGVALTEGMTPAQQVLEIQRELDARDMNVSVTLEDGKITLRHNEYGSDFSVSVSSSRAGADSGFTNAPDKDIGQDLEGTINGVEANVEADVLVGKSGFGFENLRVRVSNDFLGNAGQIRLNDGLGSSFTKLMDSFVGFEGVLSTRINSFNSTISRVEQQIDRVTERASLLETRLRKQFVNLEVTLGRLNATGEFLTAQLKTLPGVQINKK